ncbi:760_t:CDS:2 [Paraglomus occultum]|uniref:Probable RNA polymerase II nuclear localization protein SLC7A6OS n=1 Tax=Paraglomus occultum TaxID=144539 RepID=A0A9N9G496_9GLOM|nr:760_t:CDS:2 [Paraglomus occultum]
MKFTILRLKRKRNEEPLDALVVQQLLTNDNNRGGKKARRAVDNKPDNMITQRSDTPLSSSVFRYAETVDEKSFEDATQTTQLRERIARLVNRKEAPRSRDSDTRRIKQIREQQIAQFNDDTRRERYRVINRNRFGGKEGLFNQYVQSMQDRPIERVPEASIEYVYDIFYKDDSNLLAENNRWQNVAPAIWSDGENEVLLNDDSSDSQYFTEDEDSNAEDHYTHDYPDEDEVYSDQADSDYHEADSYDSHDVDSDNDYEEEEYTG